MTTEIPQNVLDILAKLDAEDQGVIKSYINQLRGVEDDKEEPTEPMDTGAADEESDNDNGEPFPPIYESGDDMEKAGDLKMEAADLKADGKWSEALEKYTAAVLAAEPSPLLYANRAMALLKLNRPRAAERDCNLALAINPDSAKALRVRGKARKELEKWELALHDLSAAQQIDFDEGTVEDLKFLTEKHLEAEKESANKRNEEKEKQKKRAEEIKKAQEEAKREAEKEAAGAAMGGGMPGMGGMPGGMPGMGGMGGIMQMMMSDPEIAAGLQNPKVMAALQELMSQPGGPAAMMQNPAKLQELMSDPEVGPVLQKLMTKMGGAMGGGGMPPGGFPGGMPGAGAAPGGGSAGGDDDDIDFSDLPDLE